MLATQALDLWALFGVCVLGAMSPGPSLIVMLRITAHDGTRAAIFAAWAHALGVGMWAALTLGGWSAISRYAPWATTLISLAGALYLIYLAYLTIQPEERRVALHHDEPLRDDAPIAEVQLNTRGLIHRAMPGLVIAVSNPKLMIFFTAIYTQVLPSAPSHGDQAIACLTPMIIDGAWYTLVAVSAARWGVIDLLTRYRRAVNYLSAALFVSIAAHTVFEVISASG